MDAGNIWDFGNEGAADEFSFDSIGLDWGLGIRLNMDFILLRVDAGVRLHDPGRADGDRWGHKRRHFRGERL